MFGSPEGNRTGLSSSANKVGTAILKWKWSESASSSRNFLRVTTNTAEQLMSLRVLKFPRGLSEWLLVQGLQALWELRSLCAGNSEMTSWQLKPWGGSNDAISTFLVSFLTRDLMHVRVHRVMVCWLPPWGTCSASCFALIISPWAFRDAKLPTHRQVACEKSTCLMFGKLFSHYLCPFFLQTLLPFVLYILTGISPTLENFSFSFKSLYFLLFIFLITCRYCSCYFSICL